MLRGLAFLLAFTPPADVPAQVTVEVASEEGVGKLKQGLMCLPAGGLEAKDIAFPQPRDILSRIGNPLARGQVLSIRASVCTKFFGVGNAPKSKLTIKMAWRLDGETKCGQTFEGNIEAKGRDLRHDPTVMIDAIEQSYRRWQEAGPNRDC